MIFFMDVNKFVKGLKPVTSTEIITRTGDFHPDGLFSEFIFGPLESKERKNTFSFIDLYTPVIHPTALKLFTRLDRRTEAFFSTTQNFILTPDGSLQPVDDGGVTGIKEFIKMFPDIKFKGGTPDREKFIKKLQGAYKDGTLFLDKVPVIPPEQRPAFKDDDGNWIIDKMNDYYVSILRKSFHIKASAKQGPLFDLLNYDLQKAVAAHDDFVRTLIQKKSGLIRSQLLGKRSDFSGRAVITPGPDLKVNEIGIPLQLAIPLFEPFIIHRLLYSGRTDIEKLKEEVKSFTKLELSVDSLKRVFKSIKNADKIPKSLYDIIYEATEVAMMGRIVLAKRDPVLHAESVRAFKAVLVPGTTIKVCALQVGGFNADFDGDTMAVFHPITNESQEEAKQKMMRIQATESANSINFEMSKEMCVGLYIITKDVKTTKSPISITDKDLEEAKDPYVPVLYRRQRTTLGKALFNSAFPPTFPFVDKVASKKVVNSLIPKIAMEYGQDQAIETFSKLEKIGFKFATIMAPTFSIDNVQLPAQVYELKKKLKGASPEEAIVILNQIKEIVKKHLKDTGLYDLVESGAAKGGWDHDGPISQMLVAKGIISDPSGNILPPIEGSFSDGLTNEQFFAASAGARKGIIDRVLNTADTGYMSRQLAFVLNSVEIDRRLKDCKTKRTMDLRLTDDIMKRLYGRFVSKGGTLKQFDPSEHKTGETINLRTPIYCESKKICHTCYGRLLEKLRTPYAGIVAAQVIGERGTQLIMRTFHTGGAVTIKTRDVIQDIVSNDPLLPISKSEVGKYLKQTENQVYCLKPCKIIFSLSDYDQRYNMTFYDGKIRLKGLISRIEFEDITFNFILDYEVELYADNTKTIDKQYVELYYEANETILEMPMEAKELKQQVLYIQRVLGGREVFKDVNHLFRKLYSIYGPLAPNMDLIHLEILLSQVLRDKTQPNLPARLGKTWDPVMMNIKQVIFSTSFIQGLAFENINEAIRRGLVAEEPEDPSILERVLTGELLEK